MRSERFIDPAQIELAAQIVSRRRRMVTYSFSSATNFWARLLYGTFTGYHAWKKTIDSLIEDAVFSTLRANSRNCKVELGNELRNKVT